MPIFCWVKITVYWLLFRERWTQECKAAFIPDWTIDIVIILMHMFLKNIFPLKLVLTKVNQYLKGFFSSHTQKDTVGCNYPLLLIMLPLEVCT